MRSALKYEITADPSKPVEEISEFISLMIQTHPDKQIEILQKVDENIGIALASYSVKRSQLKILI
ncbi:hypothetical protein RJP21_04545 [Paenibacillus sp. VCA1]|uniref:hypothetical protein n=1 Tax=Paenibacillus sp. VCA1 TaxID=3039148 RepID=UPI002870B583|nr:hypothetical protein [Paenibacillus sp. VCA1]MDR9852872.1 hypothetical protein [Paenibacillus sp. VCA1]